MGVTAELNYETDFTTNPPTVTYHIFYAYNDGPGPQNHEGDWERITLELDPDTLEPTTALYNAHNHVNVADYDQVVDPQTGRPVVYVADGTHAGHATPGEKDTEAPFITENTVENPNGLPIREWRGAVIYEDWGNLRVVTQQDWYTNEAGNDGVQWGETGSVKDTSGPNGPSADKSALENPNRAPEPEGLFDRLNPLDVINPFDRSSPIDRLNPFVRFNPFN